MLGPSKLLQLLMLQPQRLLASDYDDYALTAFPSRWAS